MRYKYPRTPHLPWSNGKTADDIAHPNINHFEGKTVVVTEKMDGENTSMYSDYIHARSVDSRFHPSRSWVKNLQAEIGYRIPPGWRICGENLYARHSIAYPDLESYFLAFSVWDEINWCLCWQDSKALFERLGLAYPRELYIGVWCEKTIKNIALNVDKQEGYVVRVADSFCYSNFAKSVAKWVRQDHVNSEQHWMHAEIIPNGLRGR